MAARLTDRRATALGYATADGVRVFQGTVNGTLATDPLGIHLPRKITSMEGYFSGRYIGWRRLVNAWGTATPTGAAARVLPWLRTAAFPAPPQSS